MKINQLNKDLISHLISLVLATSFHSLVLYGWIFKFPAFFGTANFGHFIQEFIAFIANTNLATIKTNYRPIIFILLALSIPVIAITSSLNLCYQRNFKQAARWSGRLCALNILIIILHEEPIIVLLVITIGAVYMGLNKRPSSTSVQEQSE